MISGLRAVLIVVAVVAAAAACTAPPPQAAAPSETAPASPTEAAPPTAAPSDRPPPRRSKGASEPPAPARPAPSEAEPRPRGPVAVRLVPIARLDSPTALADRSKDDAIYVAERGGVVRRLDPATGASRAVLDMRDRTVVSGEQGLLGLEFNGDGTRLFVSYTDTDGHSRVDAYRMRGSLAVEGTRRELFFAQQPFANHNGGNIALGPDGRLYLALGDGGGAGDPLETAQDPSSPLGKLFRLGGAPGQESQVALGLRNPWRFSFDRETGDVWIGDVGQSAREEVNRVPFARLAGSNFGWDNLEGNEVYEGGGEPAGYVPPVFDYTRDAGGCSVTGGYVYRGSRIPGLVGRYVYSDYCDGLLRTVELRGRRVVEAELEARADSLVSFGEDAAGELYALSLDGPVYRLEPR